MSYEDELKKAEAKITAAKTAVEKANEALETAKQEMTTLRATQLSIAIGDRVVVDAKVYKISRFDFWDFAEPPNGEAYGKCLKKNGQQGKREESLGTIIDIAKAAKEAVDAQ